MFQDRRRSSAKTIAEISRNANIQIVRIHRLRRSVLPNITRARCEAHRSCYMCQLQRRVQSPCLTSRLCWQGAGHHTLEMHLHAAAHTHTQRPFFIRICHLFWGGQPPHSDLPSCMLFWTQGMVQQRVLGNRHAHCRHAPPSPLFLSSRRWKCSRSSEGRV